MATESDLRDLLQGPDPEGRAAIDLDAVLTRARRRRRPKVVVAQALGSIAAVGVLATGVAVTLPQLAPASLMVAEDSAGGAEEFASTPEDADQSELRMPTETCGAAPSEIPVRSDLVVEVEPVAADAGAGHVPVRVTLTNTGDDPVSSTSGAPTLTVTRDDVVVWYSRVLAQPLMEVTLEPGEALVYDATVELVECGSPETFADLAAELPPLSPGPYEIRGTIDIGGSAVSGPTSPLVIR